MNCFQDYITPDISIPSRSGLYASTLPGVDTAMFEGLAKVIDASPEYDTWGLLIYPRAIQNLISEVSTAMQSKFFVDMKIVSRETSEFLPDYNITSGLGGLKFNFYAAKYSVVHIETIEVFAQGSFSNFTLSFYDTDENGELLTTKQVALIAGRNVINIDTDFSVSNLFISYNTAQVSIKQTQNKVFRSGWMYTPIVCDFCLFGGYYNDVYGRSTATQVNGGGLNVKLIVKCSIEKFICNNLNLFKNVFWWKIGQEICIERRFGERLNAFTTMTIERATELNTYYDFNFNKELQNSVKSQSMNEDPICFACKSDVWTDKILP